MEGEYMLMQERLPHDYLQIGMDGGNIIYRFVGYVDATTFIWMNARITQEYMRVVHGIKLVIVTA